MVEQVIEVVEVNVFAEYMNVIANVGVAVFFAGVFAYYIIRIQPKRDDKFLAAMEEHQKKFTETLTNQQENYSLLTENQRKDFRDEMRIERESHEKEIAKLWSNAEDKS